MHVSLSHDEMFSRVHSPAALWVQSVSTSGFEVCARETGIGTNGTGVINWVAFQDQPQITHGSVTFSGIWTTETKCNKVTFSQVRQLNVVDNSPSILMPRVLLNQNATRQFAIDFRQQF